MFKRTTRTILATTAVAAGLLGSASLAQAGLGIPQGPSAQAATDVPAGPGVIGPEFLAAIAPDV